MPQKIKRKVAFLRDILSLGAGPYSKAILLREFLRLSVGRYTGAQTKPFSCRIQINRKSALVHFSGTMSEMHTMVDIFKNKNYEPWLVNGNDPFKRPISTLLDLGANIGLASVYFALSYPDISIDAYEPNPVIFPLLQKTASQFPHMRVYEKALAAQDGTVTFNYSKHTLESSMFPTRDSIAVDTKAATLDSAIKAIGGEVDLVKIDIEGAEFDVFKASTLLDKIQVMVGEAHTEQSGHTEEDLKTLLSGFDKLEVYNPNHDVVFGFLAWR